ncbi:MAG: phosphate/phosphite/phosphonate ABC transporter substrate-binding protein [Bilophila wadsworthia]
MFSRFLIAVAARPSSLAVPFCAKAAEVLNFGIIPRNLPEPQTVVGPFLADMERPPASRSRRSSLRLRRIIEGMRFQKVDLCWIGNKGAIQMVDRSDSSVSPKPRRRTVRLLPLLVVNKESPLKSVDDVLKNAAGLRFSNGDPNSTSGFLVPGYYVFAKNNVDPKKIFKNVVAANHESNALAVANRQVDVATCNNEAIGRLEIAHPEKAAQIREIWRSPLIPSDPLVWRNSLPESTKKKIADFIFGYGVKGDVAHAKAILEKLQWGPFASTTALVLSVSSNCSRKSKLQANAEMPAAERPSASRRLTKPDKLSL